MGRIRTIKPEYQRHLEIYLTEKETGLPLRAAFPGFWMIADREGRFRWQPEILKLDILPFDNIDFNRVLDALERVDLIRSYVVDGKKYGYIPTFLKHQVVNMREQKSVLPAPDLDETLKDPCTHMTRHVHAHDSHMSCTGHAQDTSPSACNILNSLNHSTSPVHTHDLYCGEGEEEREKEEKNISPPSGGSSPAPGESAPASDGKFEIENVVRETTGACEAMSRPAILDKIKKPKPCRHQAVIDAYHSCCPSLPRVESWNEASQRVLTARWREKRERQDTEWWERYFRRVHLSDFLTGRVKDFVATLNWLIGPRNMEKVLNGAYDNRASPVSERLRNNIRACEEFINT